MDPRHIAAARERIGWSYERLAEALNVSVDKLRAWESGRRPIPRRYSRALQSYVAVAERDAALRRAGYPQCEWSAAWDNTPLPDDDDAMLAALHELEDHERTCPTCIAREDYAREHLPPPPSFMESRGWAIFSDVIHAVNRLPPWRRAFVIGALTAMGLVLIDLLFEVAKSPAEFQRAAVYLGAAAILGGLVGMSYSAIRQFLRMQSKR